MTAKNPARSRPPAIRTMMIGRVRRSVLRGRSRVTASSFPSSFDEAVTSSGTSTATTEASPDESLVSMGSIVGSGVLSMLDSSDDQQKIRQLSSHELQSQFPCTQLPVASRIKSPSRTRQSSLNEGLSTSFVFQARTFKLLACLRSGLVRTFHAVPGYDQHRMARLCSADFESQLWPCQNCPPKCTRPRSLIGHHDRHVDNAL